MQPMRSDAISPRRPTCAAVALAIALAGCGGGSGAGGGERHAATTTTDAATRSPPRVLPAPLPSVAAQEASVARLARIGKPIFCGAGRLALVALTFDDGPGPYTGTALRELREAGDRATFFLVGRSVERFGRWPRRERALAAIGEHSMTHANLPALAPAAAQKEIADGRRSVLRAAGAPVTLFRPPYGAHDATVDREARREGMAQILWDVDSTDSRITPPADFHEISAQVRRHARPGSIVLMHENRGQTIRALRAILPALQRRGLRAVTVPELLAADPPSPSQLAKGADGCAGARAARPH